MTMYSAPRSCLSYSALSQKVVAFGGFVERIPGDQRFGGGDPFCDRDDEPMDDLKEVKAPSNSTQIDYDKGYADGYAKAEGAMLQQLAALQKLAANAEALQPEPTAEIAQIVCELVESLVTTICGAMPVSQQWLIQKIDQAMPYISECSEAQTLWLHPEDAALLEGVELSIDVKTDLMLPRATLQIRSSTSYLETGISPFIQQMHDALDLSEVE